MGACSRRDFMKLAGAGTAALATSGMTFTDAHAGAAVCTPTRYGILTAPHTPIAPAEPFRGKSRAGAYGDYVQQVDWTVGRILKALEETGQADNTMIIFTSDNGSPGRDGTNMSGPVRYVERFGHYPSYIYRGTKSDIWEGGHRIPFIIKCRERLNLVPNAAKSSA